METKEVRKYSSCNSEDQSSFNWFNKDSSSTGNSTSTTTATAGGSTATTTSRKINLDKLDQTLKTGASIAQSAGSVADTVKGIFGKKPSASSPTTTTPDSGAGAPPDAPKPGMGTGMKVAIAVGVLSVIGLAVYFIRKK